MGFFPPAPAASGNSYFFASRDACNSSGRFNRRECLAAFEHVANLMRDRAPKYTHRYDCVLHFKLCETVPSGYSPTILGIEILRSPRGLVALPTLAVETPPDMLRDPATAPDQPENAKARPKSPYGVLSTEAPSLKPKSPPSLMTYRRYIAEVGLRSLAFQNAKGERVRHAER